MSNEDELVVRLATAELVAVADVFRRFVSLVIRVYNIFTHKLIASLCAEYQTAVGQNVFPTCWKGILLQVKLLA